MSWVWVLMPPGTEGYDAPELRRTRRSPSEIAGIVTMVGIILFGVVTATEVLGLPALTLMVMNGILAVSAARLSGHRNLCRGFVLG